MVQGVAKVVKFRHSIHSEPNRKTIQVWGTYLRFLLEGSETRLKAAQGREVKTGEREEDQEMEGDGREVEDNLKEVEESYGDEEAVTSI
jgi:hypothetical protein